MTTTPQTRDFLYWAYARGERPGFALFKVRRVDGRLVNGEPARWVLTATDAEGRCATLNRALAA